MLGGVARIVGSSGEDQAKMPPPKPKFRRMTTKNDLRLTIYCRIDRHIFLCKKNGA